MVTIAIDPGASGAVARTAGTAAGAHVAPLGSDPAGIVAALLAAGAGPGARVYLEDVGRHVHGNNAAASASFARTVGRLEGALEALGCPPILVPPVEWMRALFPAGALAHGMNRASVQARKRAIRDRMALEYPHLTVSLRNADALGILTYAILPDPFG